MDNRIRFNIRALSFAGAIMLVGMGFFLSGMNERNKAQRETAAVYTRAFAELSANICAVNASLERVLYITTPEQAAALSSDLAVQINSAKANSGHFPVNINLDNMQLFLVQTGDYIFSLSQRAVRENKIDFTDEDTANINMLVKYSAELAEQFIITDSIQELTFEDFNKINEDNKDNIIINDRREVSLVAARETAASFLAVPATRLKNKGMTESAIYAHNGTALFNFAVGNKFIQVTREGGSVLNCFTDRQITNRLMSDADALRTAAEFLSKNIPETQFTAVSYTDHDGVLIINSAPVQDNIILYPDLIKIGVALDNCEIMFYEANNYLNNHRVREFPENIISADEAESAVPNELDIISTRLSLIDSNGAEILCHEFTCVNKDGRRFLIYVNAQSGRQQDAVITAALHRP